MNEPTFPANADELARFREACAAIELTEDQLLARDRAYAALKASGVVDRMNDRIALQMQINEERKS